MSAENNADAVVTGSELAEFIKSATEEVFTTMLALDLKPGEVYVEKQEAVPTSGVVSLIGLAGPWIGTGSLSCPAAFACRLASQLLATEYPSICEDVLDAVAEVTNMIIGNVKTKLENRLGSMGLSTPTVIYGRNFQTRSVGNQEWTVVPFDSEGSRMCVQLCLVRNPDTHAKSTRAGFPIPHMLNI